MVTSQQICLPSDGHFNVINITDQAAEFVRSSGLQNGQLFIFLQHTTGAVIIGEHETGILSDLEEMFERITPANHPYRHHIREFDYNGHAHLRAALMQPNASVPVVNASLALGTYQEILVIDDQVDQEPRYVLLQVIGE